LLVQGLIESLGIVTWIVMMMVVIMLMISIFLTTMVGKQAELWDKGDQPQILLYFGTVPRSMQTLFQYLTLDDWGMITRLVAKKMPWTSMLVFVAYVVFAAFVILSLLTGVMAEHMTNLREMTEADEKAEKKLRQKEAERTFFEAFRKLDTSHDHLVSKEEFSKLMLDDELLDKLDDISLDLRETCSDIDDFFDTIDLDRDGKINWEEFKYGLNELRSDVTSKTIIVLRSRISRLIEQSQIAGGSQQLDQSLGDATMTIKKTESSMAKLEAMLNKWSKQIDDL